MFEAVAGFCLHHQSQEDIKTTSAAPEIQLPPHFQLILITYMVKDAMNIPENLSSSAIWTQH